jgi:hypothetical protein
MAIKKGKAGRPTEVKFNPELVSMMAAFGATKTHIAQHYNCNLLWLALVPPIALSSMGIFIMIQIYRYGVHMTWENKKNDRWKADKHQILAHERNHSYP